jgi:predicted TIM-barrel fold metal-dependent hydrolase
MFIDTNVYLSRYPFRRLPGDEPPELMAKLRQNKVTQAWAGSFDALLHRDLGAVNARLAAGCRRWGDGLLVPFGSVNPTLPDWREEFRRCQQNHRMMGLRLHPNYHGYRLDEPPARELFKAAADGRMLLQIAVAMEDERTQHPAVPVQPVNTEPLPELVKTTGARVQLMNYRVIGPLLEQLTRAGEVYFDFSMVEGVHGLRRLPETTGQDRIVFGSYFPFYYFEAAALKVKEAEADLTRMAANARRLLGDLR